MSRINKTSETAVDVLDFVERFVDSEAKKGDSVKLMEMLRQLTGLEPKLWGPTIIGFGSYHYRYESGHEGDSPILGFSPRKTAISLYILSQTPRSKDLLEKLGKFKIGKVCIYIKRLSDIDLEVLLELCKETILYIQKNNVCSCKIKVP